MTCWISYRKGPCWISFCNLRYAYFVQCTKCIWSALYLCGGHYISPTNRNHSNPSSGLYVSIMHSGECIMGNTNTYPWLPIWTMSLFLIMHSHESIACYVTHWQEKRRKKRIFFSWGGDYTKYNIQCHMVFNVVVVTFLISLIVLIS